METVTVNAKALRELLMAVIGPAHLMGELRVCHDLNSRGLGDDDSDPIGKLAKEYNAAVEEYNAPLPPAPTEARQPNEQEQR